jgi:hypothetical protein
MERVTAASDSLFIESPTLCKVLEQDDCTLRPRWILFLKLAFHDATIPSIHKEIASG